MFLPETLLLALVVLSIATGAGGAFASAINFLLLMWHVNYVNSRVQDVRVENARLRENRAALENELAAARLKLEMSLIENARAGRDHERDHTFS
jgi:hypothetical protein